MPIRQWLDGTLGGMSDECNDSSSTPAAIRGAHGDSKLQTDCDIFLPQSGVDAVVREVTRVRSMRVEWTLAYCMRREVPDRRLLLAAGLVENRYDMTHPSVQHWLYVGQLPDGSGQAFLLFSRTEYDFECLGLDVPQRGVAISAGMYGAHPYIETGFLTLVYSDGSGTSFSEEVVDGGCTPEVILDALVHAILHHASNDEL